MSDLFIDYNSNTQEAVLQTSSESDFWPYIKRLCYESSDEILEPNPLTLIVPWWVFLGKREGISYHLRKHGVALEITDRALALLERSQQRVDHVFEGEYPDSTAAEDIEKALRDLGFVRALTDFQLKNVSRLLKLPAGATFSVPGAGKTTEALALYVLSRAPDDKLLVICPKNAFAVWEDEIQECLPNKRFRVVRLTGGFEKIRSLVSEDFDVGILSYQQLPTVVDTIAKYLTTHSTYVFLDESHKIKRGVSGVIGSSILKISHLPKRKLIMSGTPLPNSPEDLVPQFRFLYPEIPANTESVSDRIRSVFVRTTHAQLGIPEIQRKKVEVSLTESQNELYQLMRSEIARGASAMLTRFDKGALRRLGRSALKLIQLVSNPTLLARVPFEHPDLLAAVLSEDTSPKMDYVVNRCRELAERDAKVIVWTSFVESVELVATRLSDLGAGYIHGGVDAGSPDDELSREGVLSKFRNDPESYVLVANPAAAGEGISLHQVCRYAIYLDRTYNAAQYLQSEDRIHRLGLKPDQIPTVEIILAPNTIDESVNRRLVEKANAMREVLDDDGLHIDPIPWDPEADAFDLDDAQSLLAHLNDEV